MGDNLEKSEQLIGEVCILLEWLKKVDVKEPRKTRDIFHRIEELKVNVSSLVAEVLRKNPLLVEQLIRNGSEENPSSGALKRGRGRPGMVGGSRKSKLSLFLVEWRAQMKLSQAQLQEKMVIDKKQYISKVEIGNILVPNNDFLQKLSELTGKTFEELKEMATDRFV